MLLQFGQLSSLLLVSTTAAVVWILWKKNRRNSLLDKLPRPRGLPILGNILQFIFSDDSLAVMTSVCKQFDGICRVNLFTDNVVMLTGPEYLRTFYTSRNTDRADLYNPIKDVFYNSIFIANGQSWKDARKMHVSFFFNTPPQVLLDVFKRRSKEFLSEMAEKAQNGGFFPLLEHLQRVSANSLFEHVYGEAAPPEIMRIITEDMTYLMKVCYLRSISPIHYFRPVFRLTPEGRRFQRVTQNVRATAERYVAQKMDAFKEIKRKGEPVPSIFLYSVMENRPEMTIKDIASELINLAPAAVDTTSETIGFLINMLALHPDVQEKVFLEDRELRESLSGREPTADDLQQYVFLEMVIKETLRLFPVAPIIGRKLSEDTLFGEYLVPAGTNVMAYQNFTNHNAEIFPDPLKFDPERFLPDNAKKIPPYAFNPFSNGPRNCPGQKYSYLSMKTLVIGLVRQYRIFSKYSSLEEAIKNAVAELTLKDRYSFTIRLESRIR